MSQSFPCLAAFVAGPEEEEFQMLQQAHEWRKAASQINTTNAGPGAPTVRKPEDEVIKLQSAIAQLKVDADRTSQALQDACDLRIQAETQLKKAKEEADLLKEEVQSLRKEVAALRAGASKETVSAGQKADSTAISLQGHLDAVKAEAVSPRVQVVAAETEATSLHAQEEV
ncbi:hypothetical protein BCR44DRAFT_1458373 [Catenaria anguillulae PL171]|uniref:Uncharacterized protein n=1 Tax=Catenaria anguillulae PL171 TaxID=765915 RepID=A0A1Y2HYA0_9FUNG|nr:hypothetical protein BCR44DRAFT_1458373 [Catenaria anguillulae PL171]